MSLADIAERKLQHSQNNPVPQSLGTASMQSNFEVEGDYGERELKRMRLRAVFGAERYERMMTDAKAFFNAHKREVIDGEIKFHPENHK